MNLRVPFNCEDLEQGFFRAKWLASDCGRCQLIEVTARALILHELLHKNCGTTADWPLDLVARDENSAKELVCALEDLREALEWCNQPNPKQQQL